mmetsp:Transcript_46356/g.97408  ORF Transcript_46356/g.97408 Transcript_46356/m.97408 type:complete len:204 (-) Transcript_46356:151-762(-)
MIARYFAVAVFFFELLQFLKPILPTNHLPTLQTPLKSHTLQLIDPPLIQLTALLILHLFVLLSLFAHPRPQGAVTVRGGDVGVSVLLDELYEFPKALFPFGLAAVFAIVIPYEAEGVECGDAFGGHGGEVESLIDDPYAEFGMIYGRGGVVVLLLIVLEFTEACVPEGWCVVQSEGGETCETVLIPCFDGLVVVVFVVVLLLL